MSRPALYGLLLLLGACQCSRAPAPPAAQGGPAPTPAAPHAAAAPPPPAAPLAVCEAGGEAPLEAARRQLEAQVPQAALSCAAQATALAPDSPEAHTARALALAALGRSAEAQLAYARALALDPEHPEALAGAAHLYAVQLPSSRELDELGALYAERGLALSGSDPEGLVEFALLSAIAHNDLGEAQMALERAGLVLAREPQQREALYERALALFELCRFADARRAFAALLDDPERGPHAHHHLGLLLEREGRLAEAETHLARARSLAPDDFGAPPLLSVEDFRAEVARALAALPADMRADLTDVPVTAEELPAAEDLLSVEPPLSPAILGLYRGPPLGEPCEAAETPCRSVALYRRNLARAVRTREELLEQIRVTLLHEVGHLRGEDDYELAARGLE